MKYKLTLMFIFSFIVHITIAGALVYVPHQISIKHEKSLDGEVIWGRIQGREGRTRKQETRSKKQEIKSEKLEVSSEEQEKRVDNSGEAEGRKDDENVIPTVYSAEPNVHTGNDTRVLLASSDFGHSHSGEGDEAIKAEKGRIYHEQLKGLIEQARKEIEKNKYYPFLAKIRGLEGTVLINFHIGQDGKAGSVAIQKSSGSQILDESAVKTIKRLKPFRNINPELRELDISVPITYKLTEQ